MTKLPLKVINIFAAPGVGKSTTASGLFNLMKVQGHSVELVTEWAKEATYERNMSALENQLVVIGEQDRRIRRLVGQAEWAITDSPLPLGIAYAGEEYGDWITPAIWGAFRRYRNHNVLLGRDPAHPYQQYGRNQTEEQSRALDRVIGSIYATACHWGDPALGVQSDEQAPYRIYNEFVRGAP